MSTPETVPNGYKHAPAIGKRQYVGKRWKSLLLQKALDRLTHEQMGKLLLQNARGDSRGNLKKFLHHWIGVSSAAALDEAMLHIYSHKDYNKILEEKRRIVSQETHGMRLFSRQGACRRSADIPWLFSTSDAEGTDYVTHTFFPRCIAKMFAGDIEEVWFIDECSDATKGTMPHRIIKAWSEYEENGYSDDPDARDDESDDEEVSEPGEIVEEAVERRTGP